MNISITEVLGPVMIGPSSSHTAGAARLARVAALIAQKPFTAVEFALHGSFAKTGRGHGTDKALLAGALGIAEDDERLRDAYAIADVRGIHYTFTETELPDCHENTALLTFTHTDGTHSSVQGASLGGGRICVTRIDGMPTEVYAELPTLVISQKDSRGVLAAITEALSAEGINIATMRVARVARGDTASTIVETDSVVPQRVVERLYENKDIYNVRIIPALRSKEAENV